MNMFGHLQKNALLLLLVLVYCLTQSHAVASPTALRPFRVTSVTSEVGKTLSEPRGVQSGAFSANDVIKVAGDGLREFSRMLQESRVSLMSGAMAKAVSIAITHPLDTFKTRKQLDPAHIASLPPLSISTLFGGIKTSLFGAVPYGAITFASYEVIKKKMLSKFGTKIRPEILLVSSAIMGDLIGSLWYCPIDILKICKQSGMYENSVDGFKAILKTRGFSGFYQGMAGHVIRDVPYRAIQLPVFDVLKTALLEHKEKEEMKRALAAREIRRLKLAAEKRAKEEKKLYRLYSRVRDAIRPPSGEEVTEKLLLVRKVQVLKPIEAMILGGIASSVAALATTPLDLLRTRLMTATLPDQSISTTVRALGSIASDIIRHEGPGEFFRGTGLRVAYMGPGAGLFFLVFEYSKSELLKKQERERQQLQVA